MVRRHVFSPVFDTFAKHILGGAYDIVVIVVCERFFADLDADIHLVLCA